MNKEVVLSFIKKNILSLICGVVALLALVLTFYPLGGMVTQLQSDAENHKSELDTLNGFFKARRLPITDIKGEPGTLSLPIPNQNNIKAGEEANASWVKLSQQSLDGLRDLNQLTHTPLVPAFPKPATDDAYFAYAKLYYMVLSTDPSIHGISDDQAVPKIVADPALLSSHHVNLQNDILKGGLPPAMTEIKEAGEQLWKTNYEPMVIEKNGQPVNKEELTAAWNAEMLLLPTKLKSAAAKLHKIYVEKDAFTISSAIPQNAAPTLPDMWYAQMQLWIQQDLAIAINEENGDSKSVFDSSVKRLISMQIPPAPMYVFPPAAAGGATQGGVPATVKDTEVIAPIHSISLSGRYSNGMYDVVPFRLVVDIDATKVNHFIEQLSKGRLMTINSQNEFALNPDAESARGYLYGNSPAVRLVLDGEALYLRSWTEKLMPERVKQNLGLIPGGTPGAPAGAGGFSPPGFPGGPGAPGMMPPGMR